MLPPIRLNIRFTNDVMNVVRRSHELQEAYRTGPTHVRFTSVFLQCNQNPLYLALSAESIGQEFPVSSRSFSHYLYLMEVYDNYNKNDVPSPIISSGVIPHPNEINVDVYTHVNRDYVISDLRSSFSSTRIRMFDNLALLFVESIRLSGVRDVVQNAINVYPHVINFREYSVLINDWESLTRRLYSHIRNAESGDPDPDWQYNPTYFNVRVPHINSILNARSFQIPTYLRCHNPQRKQRRRRRPRLMILVG
ncbi:unnamed protein product [Didymodactylos carnosus]|uniref:Uncharacterized protein n=1 Tax=Didymodactylos carnosus TaxID=1234261 RepID=A0A8S2T247_9BILA|nr:unnamed protein product [Didymodactylos carnosus]CAF4262195.1 unnamed protein product [Didymodactylos carnosus]